MALEDYREAIKPAITEEDLIDNLVESKECMYQIDASLEELDRLEDVEVGLACLGDIVASIESATLKDLAFVEAGANLAMAGTDMGVESLFPSLEASQGQPISLKKFKETVKKIWEAIRTTAQRIWKSFTGFIKRILDSAELLQQKNRKLMDRVEEASSKTLQEPSIALDSVVTNLVVNGKVPNHFADIIKSQEVLKTQGTVVYKNYVKSLVETATALANAVDRFDFESPDQSLNRLVTAAERIDFTAIGKLMGKLDTTNDRRWADNDVSVASPLPGNRSLFFIVPNVVGAGDSVPGRAELLRNRRIRMASTKQNPPKEPTKTLIKTPKVDEMVKAVQLNEELLTMVLDYRKDEVKVVRARQRLEKSLMGLQKKFDSSKKLSGTASSYVRNALNFQTAFSSWCVQPHTAFTDTVISTVRAVAKVTAKSLHAYE